MEHEYYKLGYSFLLFLEKVNGRFLLGDLDVLGTLLCP
jgi:hypothetical protein